MQIQDLFVSGQEGYHTCRIPALAVALDGQVLCLYEAERYGCLRLACFETTWIKKRK